MDSLTSSVAIATWLNPLLVLNVNLQNVDQDHFSLAASGLYDITENECGRCCAHARKCHL